MNTIWISLAGALLLIGGVASYDYRASGGVDYRATCLTHEDVVRHYERSRTGLSATCNEALRARNAAR